jgi:hypothetical protein
MEKNSSDKEKILNINITYSNKEDLMLLSKEPKFVSLVLENSLTQIKKSIKSKSNSAKLINIHNFNVTIELDKSNFKPVLDNILKYYESLEEYDKCSEIKNLIDGL